MEIHAITMDSKLQELSATVTQHSKFFGYIKDSLDSINKQLHELSVRQSRLEKQALLPTPESSSPLPQNTSPQATVNQQLTSQTTHQQDQNPQYQFQSDLQNNKHRLPRLEIPLFNGHQNNNSDVEDVLVDTEDDALVAEVDLEGKLHLKKKLGVVRGASSEIRYEVFCALYENTNKCASGVCENALEIFCSCDRKILRLLDARLNLPWSEKLFFLPPAKPPDGVVSNAVSYSENEYLVASSIRNNKLMFKVFSNGGLDRQKSSRMIWFSRNFSSKLHTLSELEKMNGVTLKQQEDLVFRDFFIQVTLHIKMHDMVLLFFTDFKDPDYRIYTSPARNKAVEMDNVDVDDVSEGLTCSMDFRVMKLMIADYHHASIFFCHSTSKWNVMKNLKLLWDKKFRAENDTSRGFGCKRQLFAHKESFNCFLSYWKKIVQRPQIIALCRSLQVQIDYKQAIIEEFVNFITYDFIELKRELSFSFMGVSNIIKGALKLVSAFVLVSQALQMKVDVPSVKYHHQTLLLMFEGATPCFMFGWFSLPRPPEGSDLEDKVSFMGGGMLQK